MTLSLEAMSSQAGFGGLIGESAATRELVLLRPVKRRGVMLALRETGGYKRGLPYAFSASVRRRSIASPRRMADEDSCRG